MLNLNEEFYLKRGQKNYQLRESVEQLADEIFEKGINNVFLVGSGGSIAMLSVFADYFKKLSDIPVYLETSAEFSVANYKQLTDKSLVLLVSKTGQAEEAIDVANYCRDHGITCVGFVGVEGSPVYNIVPHKVYIDEDISAFRYIQVYFLVFRLLYNMGCFDDYNQFADEFKVLPQALIETAKKFDSTAKRFAEEKNNDSFQLWIGSGSNQGEIYRYAACVAEELFRIKTQSIHSAEFFHGCFEIVDDKTTVVLIKGEDESRSIDERVERFLNIYSKNTLIIDLKEFPLNGISEKYRKYLGPMIISILLGDRLRNHMVNTTGLSYHTRKYYNVVSY